MRKLFEKTTSSTGQQKLGVSKKNSPIVELALTGLKHGRASGRGSGARSREDKRSMLRQRGLSVRRQSCRSPEFGDS